MARLLQCHSCWCLVPGNCGMSSWLSVLELLLSDSWELQEESDDS